MFSGNLPWLVPQCWFSTVSTWLLELHFPRSPSLWFSALASPMRSLCEFGNLEGRHDAAAVTLWISSWLEIVSDKRQTEVPTGSSVFSSPLHTLYPSLCPAPFPHFWLPAPTEILGPPADVWLQEQGRGSCSPWTSIPATFHGPTRKAGLKSAPCSPILMLQEA